jgi:hypothetical protein
MDRVFDELVGEADSVSVDGWDFSWLEGRATEERPSWGYQRMMGERMARAAAALDIQTGGGEVLAGLLQPGGTYFSQQVGPRSVGELVEWFVGPQPKVVTGDRNPDHARAAAQAAGLEVTDLRLESLHTEFFDIGAVVYFLRKVIWMVPGFTVDRHRGQLLALHERIQRDGPFLAHTTRFLIEARKQG